MTKTVKNILKTGNLVNFYSTYASFQKKYTHRNPGLVLALRDPNDRISWPNNSAYVLWANGEITKEHRSSLQNL